MADKTKRTAELAIMLATEPGTDKPVDVIAGDAATIVLAADLFTQMAVKDTNDGSTDTRNRLRDGVAKNIGNLLRTYPVEGFEYNGEMRGVWSVMVIEFKSKRSNSFGGGWRV